MHFVELILIAVSLSMDAFAVAMTTGLTMKKVTFKKALIVGLYFGFFQAIMPLIGYFLSARFAGEIQAYDHWIAFILLVLIGGNMIRESLKQEDVDIEKEPSLSVKTMLPLALATSIDALAVGVSFAFLKVEIVTAVSFIGFVTLGLSMIGVKFGHVCGIKLKQKAEIIGGIVLIAIGTKILLEHVGVLAL